MRPGRGKCGGEQLRAVGLSGFGGYPTQPGELLSEFAAAAHHLAGGFDLTAGQLELELDAVLSGVAGHRLVHGDRFAGRRVDEKELFLNAKSGMAGHGEALIRPVECLTTGRIRAGKSFCCGPRGSKSADQGCPLVATVKHLDWLPMVKDFRFGLGLHDARSRAKVQDTARRAEELGFDVLHVPDHLGAPAPFPVLMSAAAATSTLRLGTFVLNAGFYKPALLARDVGAVRDLTEGRFELGLGTGYMRAEFEAAELRYPRARERIDHMQHVTEYIQEHLPDVPILIAGNGDRVLTIAARKADIIGLTGGDRAPGAVDPLAERIEFVRNAAPDRFDSLELNVAITAMPIDGSGMPDLKIPRRFLPDLTDEDLLRHPGVLSGSTRDMADRIRGYRDTYGVSYIIVQAPHAEVFAKVIAELR
jgi:probable F420-dependent oxidoreductase